MKVLVTGNQGYIGSVLTPLLQTRGFEVTGFDAGFYSNAKLFKPESGQEITTLKKDVRKISAEDLAGFDGVVHLAELSNDPLGQMNPSITFEINHQGTVALAKNCIKAGVPRFVYTSSCSVYGKGSGEFKTEASDVAPQTAYAECKVLVERDLKKLANDDFSPVFLRNATAYGPSPHMRFDIVLNNLAGLAWTTKEIKLISDGSPWRPLVHVKDISEAIICALNAPREAVHNQIFNVGNTGENFRIREIAQIVSDAFPGCKMTVGESDGDHRSYRVSCDKIHEDLPGFACRLTAQDGAEEFRALFEKIRFTSAIFQTSAFTRLKQLKYLLATKNIDENLFWL